MLRTLVLTLALAAPGAAFAQQQRDQFPDSAVAAEVRTDTGAVVGRIGQVERDADGRIVAVEIAGLEPGDAPQASSDLVADYRDPNVRVIDARNTRPAGGERTVTR